MPLTCQFGGDNVSKEAFFVVMSLDSEVEDIVGVYNNPTEEVASRVDALKT